MVNYKNSTKIGTAAVKIKGAGNYTGEVSKTFKITVKKNAVYTVGNYKYKITNTKTNGKGTVALSGVKSKKGKSIKVADTIEIGGKKLKKITIKSTKLKSVGAKAFKGISEQASSVKIKK